MMTKKEAFSKLNSCKKQSSGRKSQYNDRKRGENSKNGKKNKKRKNDNSQDYSYYKRPRHQKLEIKFDPEARREYLTSLSAKKKERRTFGLAMQKVKDRKLKLEEKKETKQALLEQIEEAEKNKQQELNVIYDIADNGSKKGNRRSNIGESSSTKDANSIKTFQDETTQSQFGGQVIVTTTFQMDSDDEDTDDDDNYDKKNSNKKIDEEQQYAGSVQKYISQLKGHLPNKKNKTRDNPHHKRGKHGAEGMKGMGTGKDFKMAKRTLDRTRDRSASAGATGKRRKGKSRR